MLFFLVQVLSILGVIINYNPVYALQCCVDPGCTQSQICATAENISCWNLTTVQSVPVLGGCYCQAEKDGCRHPRNITLYNHITLAEYLTTELEAAGVPEKKIEDIVNGTACFCNSDLCNKHTKTGSWKEKMPKSFYRRLYKQEPLRKWILF